MSRENSTTINMNGQKRNLPRNGENNVNFSSPDKSYTRGESKDIKTPTPRDALLGTDTGTDLPDFSLDLNNKDRDDGRRKTTRCCRSAYRWLKKNAHILLILSLMTFLVGSSMLAVSVYVIQTRKWCSNQSSSLLNSSQISDYDVSVMTSSDMSALNDTASTTSLHYDNVTVTSVTALSNTTTSTIITTEAVISATNLALGRAAYQSSTMVDKSVSYHASLATDGAVSYLFSNGSCSRTNMETKPFWYVDLGRFELVKTVKIFIPRDVPVGELHNFEVRIGQGKELDLNPLCRHYLGTALVYTLSVRCQRPMYGRYVSIVLLGDSTRPVNRLTLCEVQVYNT